MASELMGEPEFGEDKASLLLGDASLRATFDAAYAAIQNHTTQWTPPQSRPPAKAQAQAQASLENRVVWNIEVSMDTGAPYSYRVSALQAFWPALQVSARPALLFRPPNITYMPC